MKNGTLLAMIRDVPTLKIMKTFLLIFIALFTSAQSSNSSNSIMKPEHARPVSKGEELYFKLTYGWFTVGRGSFKISEESVSREGKECIKIDVAGKTAGLAGVFSRVDDKWGAIVDKQTFLPYYSFRDISEGDYDLYEKVHYDYNKNEIKVEASSKAEGQPRPTKYFDIDRNNVFDLMGGLMYARSLDYRAMKPGDTIRLNAFFDKEFYDFGMVYQGIELTDTRVGEIYCHKVVPIMQTNKVFKGQDAVTFWVSADANRLPLKVSANMSFGTAYCELTSYKNVKSGIDFE